MEPAPEDRRVRRTRQLLHEALIELSLERGYQRVTVTDILQRADIGRSTFYAHYKDKDDLLVSGLAHHHPHFAAEMQRSAAGEDTSNSVLEPMRAAFRHAEANRRLYQSMVGRQGAEVVRRLLPAPLSELLRAHLRALYPVATSDEQRLTVTVQFVVSAFLGLLTWWLDEDVPMPADDIHEIFRQLAAEGVGSFLAT